MFDKKSAMIKGKIKGLILFYLFVISSCGKSGQKSSNQVSQDFFISFATPDSNYSYKTGQSYQFLRDGSFSDNLASDGYHFSISPATLISPLPTNANIHVAGFVFNYSNIYPATPPWTDIGNILFTTGPKMYCYTGINYISNLGGLSCIGPNSIVVFWMSSGGIVQNSGSGIQPPGSFYQIDSVTNFHHEENLTLKIYDKIISGSFQCRVFDPTDTSRHTDLTGGHFRMPVWRNAQN